MGGWGVVRVLGAVEGGVGVWFELVEWFCQLGKVQHHCNQSRGVLGNGTWT